MSHMSMWIIVVISHISMWIISDVNVNIADSHVKSRRFTCQCELSWIISHFNVNHFTCQCESSLFLTCQCELFLLYLTCQYKSFYMSTWIIVIWHVNQLIQMSNHDDSHVNVNDCEFFRMSMLIISNVMWIVDDCCDNSHINVTRRRRERFVPFVMSHLWMSHATQIYIGQVWHDSFIGVTWIRVTPMNESWTPCLIWIWQGQLAAGEWYGVASISRLLEIIGLFCKRAL